MNSDSFSPVSLSKINPDIELPADIYVKVNQKYIKFKNTGDSISVEKYNLFIAKAVKEIFISNDQIDDFNNWVNKNREEDIDEMTSAVGDEYRDTAEKVQEMKEKVYEVFTDEKLSTDTVAILQEHASDIVSFASKNKESAEILAKLRTVSDTLADHSVNVANLAVYLAMCSGHNHQFVLENVYMGAIMHDYGKSKISPKVLEEMEAGTSKSLYSQAIQDHPMKGAEMVAKLENIPDQVMTIVKEHHEWNNGAGYPQGLASENIYELTKIVSLANIYDNTLCENKNRTDKEKHKIAIKVIEYDRGKQFDPEITKRIIDGLKLAFGNFKRARKIQKED